MARWGRRLAFYGFLSIAFFVFIYALCIEPFRLVVRQYEIETDKWTYDNPLKIALIADVHAISPSMTPAHLEKIIDRLNAEKPDLVLLLGDYVATHPFGIQVNPTDGVAPYKQIKASCGVFSILGNHDLHGSKGWPEALRATGIPVLENDAAPVTCGDRMVRVAGMNDLWYGGADMSKTLSVGEGSAPTILMMHNPDSFPEVPGDVTLTVAGHTHGGQILFPFIGPIKAVVPSQYGLRYVYGHIREEGKDLVVSGGLGMTGLPMRFLRPPEIVIITLKKPVH